MEDEFDEFLREQLKNDDFRLEYESLEYTQINRTFRKDGIYRRRLQWWYPWGITEWWRPQIFKGGDEWCNDSVCVVLPPLGCLVVFWRSGSLRTLPCVKEWEHMTDMQRADYAPCAYLHSGRLNNKAHHHNLSGVICPQAIEWLGSQERENENA